MSGSGLFTNHYERVRLLATLVDNAIEELHVGTRRDQARALGEALTRIAEGEAASLLDLTLRAALSEAGLLGSILNARLRSGLATGSALDSAHLHALDELALMLERERAGTSARLRRT